MLDRRDTHRHAGTLCRLLTGLGLAAVVAVGAAGCAGDREVEMAPPPPALTREYSAVANTVEVTLDVNRIDVPEIIGSGWTNFVITNADRAPHGFAVRGEGVDRALVTPIEPGGTQQMRVQLRPGTYRVICPTCNPDEAGMYREITVARW